jgi:hypothetical protein
MKKVIRIADLHSVNSSDSKNSLIVLARNGQSIWTQALELVGGKIDVDFESNELLLKFKLLDGEYLILEDVPGSTDKMRFSLKRGWEKL